MHAVSFLEARVIRDMDVGSHTVFTGKVVNADMMEELHDLRLLSLDKGGTTPKAAATYQEDKSPEAKR